MAYRRRQGSPRSSTFPDPPSPAATKPSSPSPPSSPLSLAAQAIRASSAHRDSSISSAYGDSAILASNQPNSYTTSKDSGDFECSSMKNLNESKYGFWGVLARKAKLLIDDDKTPLKFENNGRKQPQAFDSLTSAQFSKSYQSPEGYRKAEALPSQRSPDSIASSLNHIGGTIKNALEEGLSIVENRTTDIIQETRKLNIRRKGRGAAQNQATDKLAQQSFPHVQADHETQLKASRDVANAMAAKAKLLLRELKTVKADLAFAKERCAQLEEENKMLRESHEKGGSLEDDDLVRLQLETLVAEKGRLAHENSVYARENRFLREIVEYHQLTMQDVVYVDEGIDEVTKVFSNSPSQILSRSSSISNSTAHEHPSSPDIPVPCTPTSTTKLQAIVVPEACPIIPLPPTPSSRVMPGVVSPKGDVNQ